jgi:trimethylamine--corrinoid protein Co-methyltransferase
VEREIKMKGFIYKFRPLEILTAEQIEVIHQGALDVLQKTGIRFEHERALKLLEDSGCQIDHDKKSARIPEYLVEECLRKCPSSFAVKPRDPKNALRVGGNIAYFGSNCGLDTVDLDTWEPRTPKVKDNDDAVRVIDALDHLDFLSYGPYHHFEDVPTVMAMTWHVASCIRNTTKVIMSGTSQGCEFWNIKMANATGQRTFGGVMASPPLTWNKEAIEGAFNFTEAGFPIMLVTGDAYGGTSPATLAGSTVSNNAEMIGALVLIQLFKPGASIIFVDYTHPLNMRSGSLLFGSPEVALHQMIFNQICRHYRIPCWDPPGYPSSKILDSQYGYEKMMQTLSGALSGGNLLDLAGCVHGELTWHSISAVLDDDIAGMVGRFIEGVEVSDETLAIDLIEEVGQIPGHYLGKEHTRKWWKSEQFVPKAADRLTYPEWMKTGKRSALDYAKKRMEEILATHEPKPLTDDQEDAIENILEEARNFYRERGLISDEEMKKYRERKLSK